MKEIFQPISEGFFGSFALAGALIAAVSGGVWRGMNAVFSAFVRHQPMPISPTKSIKTP